MTKILLLVACLLIVMGTLQAQTKQPFKVARDSGAYLMRQKQYAKALQHFRKSFELGNTNCDDYYNAACGAALLNNKNEAFTLLLKSIDQGFFDKPWVQQDTDLITLRADKRWTQVEERFNIMQRTIANKFAVIKNKDPRDLVPFSQKGRWGYMDRTNQQVLVKPEFEKLAFMNGCAEALYRDETKILVKPSGEITIVYPNHREMLPDVAIDESDQEGPFPLSSANGFRGFKMNAQHVITEYSDLYKRYSSPNWANVDGPFLINGKYYAIVRTPEKAGVIDETGQPLPGFDFVHQELVMLFSDDDTLVRDIWFFYLDDNHGTGYKNPEGKVKLAGELPEDNQGSTAFGYQIIHKDEHYGVLDLYTLEWIIKPQAVPILKIDGKSTVACGAYPKGRKDMVDVYFLMDGDEGRYYVDREMKAYK